jgi:hypothetical protein
VRLRTRYFCHATRRQYAPDESFMIAAVQFGAVA